MSEMKTTPGPWEARGQRVFSPDPSCLVAWCGESSTHGVDGSRVIDIAECEANARAIAAAPTILSALKAMDAALTRELGAPDSLISSDPDRSILLNEAWIQIRSAISQADGR